MFKKIGIIFSVVIFATSANVYGQLIDQYSVGVSGNMSNIINNDIDDFRDFQFGYGIGFWGQKNITPKLDLIGGIEFSAVRFQLDNKIVETTSDNTKTGRVFRDKATSSLFILSIPVLAEIELPLGFYGQLGPRADFKIASNNGTVDIDAFGIRFDDRLSDIAEVFTFGWSAGLGKKIGIAGLDVDLGFRFNGDVTDLVREEDFTDMKKQRIDLWIKLPLPF